MAAPTFLQVLKAETMKFQAQHPEREAEIARASALITLGMVSASGEDPTEGRVLSSDGQTMYSVNGTCSCPSGQHGKPCKHLASWRLYQHVAKKVEAAPVPVVPEQVPEPWPDNDPEEPVPAPPVPPPALPEAPASVNVRLLIEGRDCQLTLRDADEARLLQRLQAVLAQYPVPSAPEPSARPEGWCSLHAVQMTLHRGKNGQSDWFSHRTRELTWCKGK